MELPGTRVVIGTNQFLVQNGDIIVTVDAYPSLRVTDFTFTVAVDDQCGGDGSWCGKFSNGPCIDAQWPDYVCEEGSTCVRWNKVSCT